MKMNRQQRQEADKALRVSLEHLEEFSKIKDKEGWEVFTGTPVGVVESMLEWGHKTGESPEILLTLASALGFAHAKKIYSASASASTTQATDTAKAASDSE